MSERLNIWIAAVAALAAVLAAIVAWWQASQTLTIRQEEIRSSSYALSVVGGTLILSASETSPMPSEVTIRPYFAVPGSRLREGEGDPARTYDGFVHHPHLNGKAIRIDGIRDDVCKRVESNFDRCSEFDVTKYQVVLSFGPFSTITDYVSVSSPASGS